MFPGTLNKKSGALEAAPDKMLAKKVKTELGKKVFRSHNIKLSTVRGMDAADGGEYAKTEIDFQVQIWLVVHFIFSEQIGFLRTDVNHDESVNLSIL